MSTRNLLAFIRSKEAPRGYDQMYSGAEAKIGRHALTKMTLGEIFNLQRKMLAAGSASSALGGYQFLMKTLGGLCTELGLHANERFDQALQDRLAMRLLERRGLRKFLAGSLSREDFANNLAMEWASLPVVTAINGKRPGQSYYAGDGLNAAFHDPSDVLRLLDALKSAPPAFEPVPTRDVPRVNIWTLIVQFFASIFKGSSNAKHSNADSRPGRTGSEYR